IAHVRRLWGPDDANLNLPYSNLGVGMLARGRYQEARFYIGRAYDLNRQNLEPGHPDMVASYLNMAAVFQKINKPDSSLQYLKKSIQYAKRPSLDRMEALGGLGQYYLNEAEFDLANQYYEDARQEALNLFGKQTAREATFMESLGEVAVAEKKYATARIYFSQALDRRKHYLGADHPSLAYQAHRLADIDRLEGENEHALRAYRQSLRYNQIEGQQGGRGIQDWKSYLAAQLGRIQIYLESYRHQSDSVARGLLAVEETLAFLGDLRRERLEVADQLRVQEDVHKLVELGLRFLQTGTEGKSDLNPGTSLQLASSGQAVLLKEAKQRISDWRKAGVDKKLVEVYDRLTREQNYLNGQLRSAEESFDLDKQQLLRRQLSEVTWTLDSLRRQIGWVRKGEKEAKNSTGPLERIQQNLAPTERWVQYFWGKHILWVWTIDQGQARIDTIGISEALREAILVVKSVSRGPGGNKQSARTYARAAHMLYVALLQRQMRSLNPNSAEAPFFKLHIVPDGELFGLPFEALLWRKAEGNETWDLPYLIHRAQVSYHHGPELSRFSPEKPGGKGYLGMAPSYGHDMPDDSSLSEANLPVALRQETWQPIPYATQEVRQAVELWKGGLALFAEDASEQRFLAEAPTKSVLHLAMHAMVDEHYPQASGLVFGTPESLQDSLMAEMAILRAYEIESMTLAADLAVLSACETGAGQVASGEGVMSLARSFSIAGAQSVITSLWAAADAATASIMRRFWVEVADGVSRGEALRQAKLNFLKKAYPLQKHPFFWANFVLIGEDGPLESSDSNWIWGLLAGFLAIGLVVWIWRIRRSSGKMSA
ncbi:MAG: CHAT domain-containing tetratricopeptide repeat protein, partial [Bacteroidota bacterium]